MRKFFITLFLGWAGVHKFIEKKTGIGILYLLTFGLFGIGWLIDIIIAATKIKTTHSNQTSNNIHKIDVVGEYYRKNEISSIMSGNKLYNLPDHDFINKVASHKNIYRFRYREAEAQLIPEPTNPYDSNAIKVMVDNVHIGYIPTEQCVELKKKLSKVKSVKAKIRSGDYKYHSNNEVFKTEADFSIELYITM